MARHLLAPLACLILAPSVAAASSVRHIPAAEARVGDPLRLEAQTQTSFASSIAVRFRVSGATAYAEQPFRREGDAWVAIIPARAIRWPGLEYYLVSVEPGGVPVAEFGSAEHPHRVAIQRGQYDLRREADLRRRGGHRSRLHVAGEWVDFGTRSFDLPGGPARLHDRYYRIDADFSYLLLTYPLKGIRIGYTRLLGNTPDTYRDDPTECGAAPSCELEAGYKVGGWFELRFALADAVEVDTRGSVMATSDGFHVGGRGELRLGVEDGSNVALGGEVSADVGATGFFRLGWATVPGLPMATTVELSTYPSADRAAAVRLLYDVAHPFPNGLTVGARLGYQARDEHVGGVAVGLATSLDF